MVYNTDPLSFHWISKGYESPFSTSGFWYRNYFVADLVPKIRISWDRIKLLIIVGYIYIYPECIYIYVNTHILMCLYTQCTALALHLSILGSRHNGPPAPAEQNGDRRYQMAKIHCSSDLPWISVSKISAIYSSELLGLGRSPKQHTHVQCGTIRTT